MENNPPKRLYRSTKNEMLGGVCGGVAEYFNLDPTLVRLAFVLFCALAGGGLIAYIVALIIIPKEPADAQAVNTAEVPPQEAPPQEAPPQGAPEAGDPATPDDPTML